MKISTPPVRQADIDEGQFVSKDPRDRLVVALDVGSTAEALHLAGLLQGRSRWVKVGMELFYAEGKDLLRKLRNMGFRVFLDLKLHDIPNTVAAAVRSVGDFGVEILTLHASGGPAMLETASAAARGLLQAPLLAGVTVLTSMDEPQLQSVGIRDPAQEQVVRLASLALQSGLRGLVASPLEIATLRQQFGRAPLLIVPGVRPVGSAADDQRRTATPEQAIRAGASLLVVGRPITRAADPAQAAEAIVAEIARGLD